jgi:hypothetical protein
MQTTNPSIYHAGPINGLSYDAARERRLYVARALTPSGIEVISPMRWKYNLKGIERLGTGGSYDDNPLTAAKGIVTRDRFDVGRCWMMLADLECPAVERVLAWRPGEHHHPLDGRAVSYEDAMHQELSWDDWQSRDIELASGGTFTEFGWADAFSKPIVTVLKPGSVHDHPFVRALSGFIVPSLDEAIDIIKSVLLAEPLPEQAEARERDVQAVRLAALNAAYSDGSRATDWSQPAQPPVQAEAPRCMVCEVENADWGVSSGGRHVCQRCVSAGQRAALRDGQDVVHLV